METIDDSLIDFDAYLRGPDENAKVKPASGWMQEVIDRFYLEEPGLRGIPMPWKHASKYFRLRPGEVSLWAGINGHGKSLVLNQVMLSAMQFGEKACIASLEMKPVATMMRMSRQAAVAETPAVRYMRELHAWTDGRLWLYDQQGTVKTDRILSVMRYCHEQLGITQFVIDSLMKCGMGEDDYNGQKAFIDELCSHARDTGVHVHLVAHSRKGRDELGLPNKMDVKGTGAITDQVDNVITVWRNKRKEDAASQGSVDPTEPDALLCVEKQRHYEWEGKIPLWFHKPSLAFSENPHTPPGMLEFSMSHSAVEMVAL